MKVRIDPQESGRNALVMWYLCHEAAEAARLAALLGLLAGAVSQPMDRAPSCDLLHCLERETLYDSCAQTCADGVELWKSDHKPLKPAYMSTVILCLESTMSY